MNRESSTNTSRRKLIPQYGPTLSMLVVVAVVAFILGALLFGGNSSTNADGHDHSVSTGAEPTL